MNKVVLLYKRAWEEQAVDLLKECFTEDAIYLFRPPEIAPACHGLPEIERYWRERVVGVQRDVMFTILRSIERDREVWLEWRSESKFPSLLPDNLPFVLWGTMILDLNEDGKISKLTEYYFWDQARRQMLEEARRRSVIET